MSVTITSVNDAPVTNNDTATGTEDTGLLISNMLANDTDVDGGDILSLQFILTQGTK